MENKIDNGTYTLINNDKGSHITIKIHTSRKGGLKGKRIISQLCGTDNENSYKGFGFVTNEDMITVWRSQSTEKRSRIAHILRSLIIEGNGSPFAETVSMKLSKRCLVCNRKLTTPKSIEDGIGPECIKNMLG